MQDQATERRRRTTPRSVMHMLDAMIEELEEMNLSEVRDVPESFNARLHEVRGLVPGSTAPKPWPSSVTNALDYCFDLQAQVRSSRAR